MNEEEFKADHFENIDELLEHCKLWINTEDYDAYCRFFDMGAMEEIYNYTKKIQQQLKDIEEYLESIKDMPDADMYIKLGEYKEFKHILDLIHRGKEID